MAETTCASQDIRPVRREVERYEDVPGDVRHGYSRIEHRACQRFGAREGGRRHYFLDKNATRGVRAEMDLGDRDHARATAVREMHPIRAGGFPCNNTKKKRWNGSITQA